MFGVIMGTLGVVLPVSVNSSPYGEQVLPLMIVAAVLCFSIAIYAIADALRGGRG